MRPEVRQQPETQNIKYKNVNGNIRVKAATIVETNSRTEYSTG